MIELFTTDLYKYRMGWRPRLTAWSTIVVIVAAAFSSADRRMSYSNPRFGSRLEDKGLNMNALKPGSGLSLSEYCLSQALALRCGRARWLSTSRRVAEGPMAVTIEDDGVTRVREVYVRLIAHRRTRCFVSKSHAGDMIEAQKTVDRHHRACSIPRSATCARNVELEFTVSAARSARDLAAANVSGREADLRLARQERDRALTAFRQGHRRQRRVVDCGGGDPSMSLDAALGNGAGGVAPTRLRSENGRSRR